MHPVAIGGYQVPAGSQVYVAPYVIHRDERWWDRPELFQLAELTTHCRVTVPRASDVPKRCRSILLPDGLNGRWDAEQRRS